MRNITPFFVLILLLFSCKHAHNQDHKHGSANEFMHRSSTESLIDNFESSKRDSYQKPDKVIEYLGDINGLTIMDIGAGSGYFSFRLAEAGAYVIAADVNDEFQAYIHEKLATYTPGSIDLVLRKIPYDGPSLADREVDKVLIVNTYHHIEDRVDYFGKVKKGLKESGELIVIDYFKKDIPVGPPKGHKISRDVVIRELRSAGFSKIDVNIDLLPYQYVIRCSF